MKLSKRALGNRRLLRLAAYLSKVDAIHKRRKEPAYSQDTFVHECGTPACALGHYAVLNPRRWHLVFRAPSRINSEICSPRNDAKDEFDITGDEYWQLFSSYGCDGAATAKQAAAYIRNFVKQRQVVCQ